MNTSQKATVEHRSKLNRVLSSLKETKDRSIKRVLRVDAYADAALALQIDSKLLTGAAILIGHTCIGVCCF